MDNDKTKAQTLFLMLYICMRFVSCCRWGNLHSSHCNFHREIKHTAFTPFAHTMHMSLSSSPHSFLLPFKAQYLISSGRIII